jgi:hypothetical protein
MYKQILGYFLILLGIFDGIKYIWQAQSIRRVGIAKGHSRKFINVAILNDVTKLLYGICINDMFIVLSSVFALITMGYNFYILYLYYPYRYRNLLNFKRPNIFLYFLNSVLPNRIRRKL